MAHYWSEEVAASMGIQQKPVSTQRFLRLGILERPANTHVSRGRPNDKMWGNGTTEVVSTAF